MRDRQQGHIESGIPFAIMAILAGIALSSFWSSIPVWARVVGGGVIVLLAGASLWGLNQPSGMAANARRQGLMDDLDTPADKDAEK